MVHPWPQLLWDRAGFNPRSAWPPRRPPTPPGEHSTVSLLICPSLSCQQRGIPDLMPQPSLLGLGPLPGLPLPFLCSPGWP